MRAMASRAATAGGVLVTGFEPFGGESDNPSWRIAEALHGRVLGGRHVQAVQLPCVFGEALAALDAALEHHAPALVLCLGQAAGRAEFSVERVAINVDDARIPDNAGASPVDEPVVPGGPAAYFSTLPVKAIVAALREAGFPAAVSQTAGTFVCNHVFYGLMHRLATRPALRGTRGGFVHVPLLPAQAARHPGQPSLPLGLLVDAAALAVETALAVGTDVRLAGGQVA